MKNTLNIKEMKIVNTEEFLNQFIGKSLTFWVGHMPILFGLSELKSVEFTDGDEDDIMLIFRGRPNEAFGVGIKNGFGMKIQGSTTSYWVDKINKDEAAVIVYSSEEESE